jgi:serine/threonine protein kinase
MSSGTLPFQQYHRTSHLGDGTFGAVVTVYNNDGEEYAMKLFMEDETTEDQGNDDTESDYTPAQPISIGTLRELSCLRLLRGENSHPNIIEMVDIQPKAICNDDDDDDEYEDVDGDNEDQEVRGAGTSNYIGMTLPLGKYGSLANAIQKNIFLNASKQQKVYIAHGLLSAIDYLHESCGIVHRDIKCDNILLDYNTHEDRWVPILIDFSLAKPINTIMWNSSAVKLTTLDIENVQHTGEVGTLVYTAPEVILPTEKGFYDGKAIDMYSIGVVILELVQNHLFTAEKYKEALVQIQSALQTLPTNVPFPNLIRQLLHNDPQSRITARDALHHEVFQKFGIVATTTNPTKQVDIQTALPYGDAMVFTNNSDENDDMKGDHNVLVSKENKPPVFKDTMETSKAKRFKGSSSSSTKNKKYELRMKMIDRVLTALNSDHPLTRYAAFEYTVQYEQIEDSIDEVVGTKTNSIPSQSLIDCCILAYRFHELQVLELPSDIVDSTVLFQHWDYDEYIDNELTILMILDYCLYPRTIAVEY